VDALRQRRELLEAAPGLPRKTNRLRNLFSPSIATEPIRVRPERSEPRAVKRRPKTFRLLTKPRHEMRVACCRKQSQNTSKTALTQAPFWTDPFTFFKAAR
jgi:hypothetical protein